MDFIKRGIIFAFLFTLTAYSIAEDGAIKEAEKLMDAMGMEKFLNQSIDQMLILQMQQDPEVEQHINVTQKFMHKYLNYESLKADVLKFYTEMFTEEELKLINDFYATSAGKKAFKMMPDIMRKTNHLILKRFHKNRPELKEMIRAEEKKRRAYMGEN